MRRHVLPPVLACLLVATLAPTAHAAPDINTVLDLTFPVAGNDHRYRDTYWADRSGGTRKHKGTDVMAPRGTPVHAAVGGTISWITGLDGSPPGYGYMITIRGTDGLEHSYVHLGTQSGSPANAYASGMARGVRVERGQHIGYVGCSGNASCTAPHLHYHIEDPRYAAQDDDYDHFRYNPYPSLVAAEARGDVPGAPPAPGLDPGGSPAALPDGQVVTPLVGDWDGNGTVTPGWVVDGRFHLSNHHDGTGPLVVFRYGTRGDIPLVGDWDGNGTDTPAIVRDGEWHFINHFRGGNSQFDFIYGRVLRGDIPLVGDWNGDGRDTAAIVRDGEWHLVNSHRGGAADESFVYGRVSRGDHPIVGNWNGHRGNGVAVIRDGTWHYRLEPAGGAADGSWTWAP